MRGAGLGFAVEEGRLKEGRVHDDSKGINAVGSYDRFDFGGQSEMMEIRASSATEGGTIELRLDKTDGELLGTCRVGNTGGWPSWTSRIRPSA